MKKLLFSTCIALLCFACSEDSVSYLEGISGKSGSITRFAIYQDYMYLLNLNEVQTYDIKQKEHPVLVHQMPTDYGLETITVYDGTVFLGSTTSLYILDISNPAAPVIQSQSDRISDIGFSGCDPVAVKGNYAYSTIKVIENACGTISAASALVVYDIHDKSAPVVVGTYALNIPNGLGYKDNYLFVCDEGSDELLVYDITDPTHVVLTAYAVSITDPYDLIVDGQKMIVSSKTDFQIFDISDITQIKRLGQISK
ncbi:MAG: hypothetical protein Q7T20_14495 [Saprospiraceae bacterium]|nr:hypothetical protein [Saprospiraceae bacterium]